MIDLLAGKVNFTFSTIPSIHEHVRGGRVRALGVTGQRSSHLPDVPSMAEAGLAGVDSSPLFGMVAPAARPGGHRVAAERDGGRRRQGRRAAISG